jgi:hypothetical protein
MNGKNSAALKPDTINKNNRDLEASLSIGALAVRTLAIGSLFDNLKLKYDLLASHYCVDTLLPILP